MWSRKGYRGTLKSSWSRGPDPWDFEKGLWGRGSDFVGPAKAAAGVADRLSWDLEKQLELRAQRQPNGFATKTPRKHHEITTKTPRKSTKDRKHYENTTKSPRKHREITTKTLRKNDRKTILAPSTSVLAVTFCNPAWYQAPFARVRPARLRIPRCSHWSLQSS